MVHASKKKKLELLSFLKLGSRQQFNIRSNGRERNQKTKSQGIRKPNQAMLTSNGNEHIVKLLQ